MNHLWDWATNQHPDVAWSIVVALFGAFLWALRKVIWPNLKEAHATRLRHAEAMDVMGKIAKQLSPNDGSSLFDKITRLEALFAPLAADVSFVLSSMDFLFNVGNHAIFRSDGAGSITYISDEYESLTGAEPHRLLGQNWEKIIYQLDLPQVRTEWESAVKRQIDFSLKFRMCDQDGNPIWVHAKARPIYSAGKLTGYMGSVQRCADPRLGDAG